MKSIEDFNSYVSTVEAREGYKQPIAFGLGVRRTKGDTTLDVFYPLINYNAAYGTAAVLYDASGFTESVNGHATLTIDQLNSALEKFLPFKDDGKDHPNIKLLQDIVNGYAEVEAYYLSLIHI